LSSLAHQNWYRKGRALHGRQVTSLITLSGASAAAPVADIAGSKTFFSSVVISVAGGNGNTTDYRLDGATTTTT
jgi:hypothetical protein